MAGLVDRIVRLALRRGMRRGVVEGSQVWLAIGAVALGVRVLQRLGGPGKPIVITERLEPGESIVVRHLRRGE